jgi:hypothetical protein
MDMKAKYSIIVCFATFMLLPAGGCAIKNPAREKAHAPRFGCCR